jgi:hypothetical protein
MGACNDYPYHDLRKLTKDVATDARVAALLSCQRRVEWRGVVIPEAEDCERVHLCGTDRRVLGDEMY